MMWFGFYPTDWEQAWSPQYDSNHKALSDVMNKQQPTVEDRMEYVNVDEAKRRYDTAWCDEYVYTPIPQEILNNCGSRSAWLPPTPKPVQDVIDTITYCYKTIKAVGRMPTLMVPEDMDDAAVELAYEKLNEILDVEWRPWGRSAGFTQPSQFPADLPIQQKRTVIAVVQKALRAARQGRDSI